MQSAIDFYGTWKASEQQAAPHALYAEWLKVKSLCYSPS